MKVLYANNVCSEKEFQRLYDLGFRSSFALQKYHYLLAEGLSHYCHVTVISSRPVNSTRAKWTWFPLQSEEINKSFDFTYLPFVNSIFIRQLCLAFGVLLHAIKWMLKNRFEARYIVCDVTTASLNFPLLIVAKIFRINVIGVITDLPQHVAAYRKNDLVRLLKALGLWAGRYSLNKYHAYVLITRHINDVVNKEGKPSVVVEGLVPSGDLESKIINPPPDRKIILYTGGLAERNGILTLIGAFKRISDVSIELWIFGDGDSRADVIKETKLDFRIKYKGVVPNADVVKVQQEAFLLVNPRPANAEFTKYSFPSKTMEYMLSGRPLLSTKLTGIPEEYYEYIYFSESDGEVGLYNSMVEIINLPGVELQRRGQAAKDFIMCYKKNTAQAEKLYKMLKCIK